MSLAAVTLANSIAAISVSGVTMKDLDQIPQEATARDCPMVYPKPDGFLSGLAIERDSFGGAAAKMTARYTLTYVYLHSPVGTGRGLFDVYQDVVTKALSVLDAILATATLDGAVDVMPQDILEFGPVSDPSGKTFHGCLIALNCVEFIN
jgi:hypothetical protein